MTPAIISLPTETKLPAPAKPPQAIYANSLASTQAVRLASKATLNNTTTAQDYGANYITATAEVRIFCIAFFPISG